MSIKHSFLKLLFVGTFVVMTHALYIFGDTQESALHHTGEFRAQAIYLLRPSVFCTYYPVKESSLNILLTNFLVFYIDFRSDSHFCFTQHKPILFLYRVRECWLHGTIWLLVWSIQIFVIKRNRKCSWSYKCGSFTSWKWPYAVWKERRRKHICYYRTVMCNFKTLLSLEEINFHVMKSQEIRFVLCNACMSNLCAVQFWVVWVRQDWPLIHWKINCRKKVIFRDFMKSSCPDLILWALEAKI